VADDENGSFADLLSERKQVHRAGDLTLRPSAPWTSAVHALLRHLEMVGFAGSPRVVGTGIDAAGREMIEFVAGDVAQDRVWSEEGIHKLGRMLRELHEATTSFRPPRLAVWQESFLRATGPETVVSHGDVGPWNVVARHGQPVALIDWELAGPVDRLNELARTGWLNARLFGDGVEDVTGLPSVEQRLRRLRVFAEGYELVAQGRVELARRVVDVAILMPPAMRSRPISLSRRLRPPGWRGALPGGRVRPRGSSATVVCSKPRCAKRCVRWQPSPGAVVGNWSHLPRLPSSMAA
jgi:hypothetical protein